MLVVRFVEGRTWGDEDVLDPANASRIAQVCKQLHSGPRFVSDFNMLELQPRYLDLVRERGFRLPGPVPRLRSSGRGHQRCDGTALRADLPCNNDLLAANFIDAGDRLWLIDYEYSGNNDPFFEIGNLWSEAARNAR